MPRNQGFPTTRVARQTTPKGPYKIPTFTDKKSSGSLNKRSQKVCFADLAVDSRPKPQAHYTGFYSSSLGDQGSDEDMDPRGFSRKSQSISAGDKPDEQFDFPLQLDFLNNTDTRPAQRGVSGLNTILENEQELQENTFSGDTVERQKDLSPFPGSKGNLLNASSNLSNSRSIQFAPK